MSRLPARLGAVALTAATVLASAAVAASAGVAAPDKGILPPKNPPRNVAPSPNFLSAASCRAGGDSAACNTIVLRAVKHARRVLEHIGGTAFSLTGFERLAPDEQLFVSANLERVERGLPAIAVLTKSLDKIAQVGAADDTDPPLGEAPDRLPGGGRWISLGGNWAGGFDNALGSDYGWMYDDRGSHWGHRDNILGRYVSKSACDGERYEIVMGAGHVANGKAYGDSETELFAGVCGATPTDVVMTWAQAEKLLHIS